jgi:hypothetical protein
MSRRHDTSPSTVRTHTQTATGAAVSSLFAGVLFVAVTLAAATAPVPTLTAIAVLATTLALLRAGTPPTRLIRRVYAFVRSA